MLKNDYESTSGIDEVTDKNYGESPIALSRVACPICRTVNEFETVRPGAYLEEGTDTDFRPLSRRWSNPRYQSVNPLLYFMATCSTCFYTREFNRVFRDPATVPEYPEDSQKTLRTKHLAMLADSGSVARRLGSSLWPDSFPIQTAISKLLLGILDEHLLERPSNSDLARWYLRIAWLFREAQPHNGHDLTSPSVQSRRDLDRAMEEINADLARLRGRVSEVMQFLQTHPQAAQRRPDDHNGPTQCRQGLQHAIEQIDAFGQTIAETAEALHTAPDQFVGGTRGSEREAFGDHASFAEFLRLLKLDSPLIPIDENEAMECSLYHYKLAFAAHGGIESGNGAMLSAYLIGELSRRLANFDDAEQYLDMARLAAHATIAENLDDRPRTALARHISVLAEKQSRSLSINRAGERR